MKNILIFIFGIGFVVAVLEYVDAVEWLDKEALACDDTHRYEAGEKAGGGRTITEDEMAAMKERYLNYVMQPEPDGTVRRENPKEGVFISKKAIDLLMSRRAESNGLVCYFLMDAENHLSLAFKPVRAVETGIRVEEGQDMFMSESFCPMVCGD